MTIDEAIKCLTNYNTLIKPFVSQKVIEAQELGLEALKRLKINRINNTFYVHEPLSGETEE